jgi:hypothetical protein
MSTSYVSDDCMCVPDENRDIAKVRFSDMHAETPSEGWGS